MGADCNSELSGEQVKSRRIWSAMSFDDELTRTV